MSYLRTSGAEVFYQVDGLRGPWVTLVNGHTRTSSDFKILVKRLVDKGFRCLTFDNRGCGQSQTNRSFSLEEIAEDVRSLWVAEDILSSYVLGISMGGVVAQLLAASTPQVSGLILISTYCRPSHLKKDQQPWGDDEASITEKLRGYFSPDFARSNAILVQAMGKQMAKNLQNDNNLEGTQYQRQAMEAFPFSELRLEGITCPTLAIHGLDDQIVSKSAAEEIVRRIPGAVLITYSGAGHLLLAERSQNLYHDITDFLANQSNS